MQLGFVGSLPQVLRADLQGQRVVVSDEDLLAVAEAEETAGGSMAAYDGRHQYRMSAK